MNFEPTQKLTFSVFFNHKKRTDTKMKCEHNLISKEETEHFFRANKTNILDSDDEFKFFFLNLFLGCFGNGIGFLTALWDSLKMTRLVEFF